MSYGFNVKHVEVECSVVRETDHAWLIDNGSHQVWVPTSQISETDEDTAGKVISVYLPEWLAIEKGLV